MSLKNQQVEQFINDGYVKVEQAFSRQLADHCRKIFWADIGFDPEAKSTWQKLVVWLGEYF